MGLILPNEVEVGVSFIRQVFFEHLLCVKHCAMLSYRSMNFHKYGRCYGGYILLPSKRLQFIRGDKTYTKKNYRNIKVTVV